MYSTLFAWIPIVYQSSASGSSSTIRRCAISFVIIYGTTFARRTVLAGSSRLQTRPTPSPHVSTPTSPRSFYLHDSISVNVSHEPSPNTPAVREYEDAPRPFSFDELKCHQRAKCSLCAASPNLRRAATHHTYEWHVREKLLPQHEPALPSRPRGVSFAFRTRSLVRSFFLFSAVARSLISNLSWF
jgi:hypothetical protein